MLIYIANRHQEQNYDWFKSFPRNSGTDILNLGAECWSAGCKKGGSCDSICGPKAACCKKGYNDPPECAGGCDAFHCCTKKG